MTRERLVYYLLIGALFASVFFLVSWWNNIQNSLNELPLTGGSICGTVDVSVSNDGITYSKDLELAKNFSRFFIKVTDNVDKVTTCGEIQLALTSYKCEDINNLSTCQYEERLDDWGPFSTDINGIARVDSPLFNKLPGEYKFQIKEANTLYAWSSPIDIVVSDKDGTVNKPVNLADYVIYSEGDIFSYISKSYLATNTRLISPTIGTTRIEIEKDTLWGDYMVRPWRVLKSDSNLYWHPIPAGQSSDGTYKTDDEAVRYMFVSPNYKVSDKRFQNYNDFIWVLGHKTYHRFSDDQGIRNINLNQFNSLAVYTNSNLEAPGLFLGKKIQNIPYTYFENNSIYNFYSNDEKSNPSLIYSNPTDRSLMVRVERGVWPIKIGESSYDDYVRIDFFEGKGNFLNGDIISRESWYFAKGIGLIKLDTKYFSASAFGGMGYDYPYIVPCELDSDCLSDTIYAPHTTMELEYKTRANNLIVLSENSGSTICDLSNVCRTKLNTATDNGIYLKSNDPNFTGFLESFDENGKVAKSFYLQKGEIFIPSVFFEADKGKTLEFTFRQYINIETFPLEQRVSENTNAWTSKIEVEIK